MAIRRPIYTTIIHPLREKFNLSNDEYAVADSINKLSNNRDFPWCELGKKDIGSPIGISERTCFRTCEKLLKVGLLEVKSTQKNLIRTTDKWINNFESLKRKHWG